MEQRPLRLGDLVDDYCPRERRLTNHAVVAIVGTEIKQTRCSTCEAEHPYKEGKVPRRRKKDANGELYDQVLAGVSGQLVNPNATSAATNGDAETPVPVPVEEPIAEAIIVKAEVVVERSVSPVEAQPINGAAPAAPANSEADDLWPAHRPLIRAQLPRAEGQQPAQPQRPIHEFTMRQQHGRGNRPFGGGHRQGGQGGQGGHGGGWNDRGGQNGDGRGGGFRHGRFDGGGGGRANGGGRPRRSR